MCEEKIGLIIYFIHNLYKLFEPNKEQKKKNLFISYYIFD